MLYNPFSLEEKTILVTGASSGIGRSVAIECSRLGGTLVITGRNKERLSETLLGMENPEKHTTVISDLSDQEDIIQLVEAISFQLNGIVQCAGLTIPKPFQFYSEKEIKTIMGVNFEAPVYLTQLLLKRKKIARSASIIFISSISGVMVTSVGGTIYAASKGAVNGIVKGLALELASKNIRVNSVNPGMIHTEIFSSGVVSKEQIEEDSKKYPLKRYGQPEEVAYAVIYLLSDASQWVTGSNIVIDGGYTLL
jgi:NAD(P)-dependent dehydrogenase (short-subunit alcohol dehydrogenase family)